MSKIVMIDAGDKGRALCELWTEIDAGVVLFGGNAPALSKLGSDLAGTILIDCSNPEDVAGVRAPLSRLSFISEQSGTEIGNVYPSAFYCGDDAGAKEIVAGLVLLESLGLLGGYLQTHVFDTRCVITALHPSRREAGWTV